MVLCWRSLTIWIYWEWHLILSWPLRSIFARSPEQLLKDLVSWGSPGEYSMINCSSGDAFGVSSCQFLNTVLQCGVQLPIHTLNKLLDRIVSGACFLAGGVLNYDLSHRWSVAVLCMLYKIRCNQKHPLCGALPVPYVPVRVTRGALIAHRYTFVPPRCRTSQYCRISIPFSVSLWNDLVDPVFDGVRLAGFKSRSNAFLLA